jgi:hypothetical protein
MLHLAGGVQFRLVGERPEGFPDAAPATPSLEDGYVRLMNSAEAGRPAQDGEWQGPGGI